MHCQSDLRDEESSTVFASGLKRNISLLSSLWQRSVAFPPARARGPARPGIAIDFAQLDFDQQIENYRFPNAYPKEVSNTEHEVLEDFSVHIVDFTTDIRIDSEVNDEEP